MAEVPRKSVSVQRTGKALHRSYNRQELTGLSRALFYPLYQKESVLRLYGRH